MADQHARSRLQAQRDSSRALGVGRVLYRGGRVRPRRRVTNGDRMSKAVLGVIGGSGLYDLPGLKNVREERIKSPWGEPSAPLRIGDIEGLPIVFLSRHDKGHRLSPTDINYRAN